MLSRQSNQGGCYKRDISCAWNRKETNAVFWLVNVKEKRYLEELDVEEVIIL
jgi:hypothetical protein